MHKPHIPYALVIENVVNGVVVDAVRHYGRIGKSSGTPLRTSKAKICKSG